MPCSCLLLSGNQSKHCVAQSVYSLRSECFLTLLWYTQLQSLTHFRLLHSRTGWHPVYLHQGGSTSVDILVELCFFLSRLYSKNWISACQPINLLFVLATNFSLIQCGAKVGLQPWLVYLSGLSMSLQTKGLLVWFPVRTHAWVVGQPPSRGCLRGNHTLMFLSLFFSFPSPLSKNK